MLLNLNTKNSYHIHTTRCDHSDIDIEKLVKDAISCGYEEIAITDHIWYDNEKLAPFRVHKDQAEEYLNTCCEIKSKYADQIKILVGYESEYIPEYLEHYRAIKSDGRVDFMLLSNHYYGDVFKEYKVWFEITDDNDIKQNLSLLKEAWGTGIFDMFAHPDILFHKYPFNECAREVAKEMGHFIVKNNIPVEVNANGIRKQSPHLKNNVWQGYPNYEMWQIFQDCGVKTVISNGDTHFHTELDDEHERLARKIAIAVNEGTFNPNKMFNQN